MGRITEVVNRIRSKRKYSAYPSERKSRKSQILIGILILVAAGSLGLCGFYYLKYQKLNNASHISNLVNQAEASELVDKVSRLMVLPKGEVPTIATVSDFSQLKDQPFFANASDGDKLLIYSQVKTAILYSPKSDKIINVGPLNIEKQSEKPTQPSDASIRVALYNGTSNSGLTAKTEELLKSKLNSPFVTQKTQAKRSYTKTKVIAIAANQEKNAAEIAKLLGGEVSSLPENEISPKDSDILVIIGE